MKRGLAILFVGLLLASFVSAQVGSIEGQIDDARNNLENNITKIREFGEKDKWDFIGSQWKEFLLKNRVIAGMDAFFSKINVVFVVLFARDWSISLEMFFILILWIFTLISLIGYIDLFLVKSGFQKFFIALALTIVLAQARLFYFISIGLNKIILYKVSTWWKFMIFIVIIAGFAIYLILNKEIAKSIKKSREKQKVENLERKTGNLEKFKEGIVVGAGGTIKK